MEIKTLTGTEDLVLIHRDREAPGGESIFVANTAWEWLQSPIEEIVAGIDSRTLISELVILTNIQRETDCKFLD